MSRVEEIAWAAGLFEGEGSMGYYSRTSRPGRNGFISMQLRMHERDEDVVRRFSAIVGVGRVRLQPARRDRIAPSGATFDTSAMWSWQASGSQALTVIDLLLPHFGQRRRARAESVLAEVLARPTLGRAWKQPSLIATEEVS